MHSCAAVPRGEKLCLQSTLYENGLYCSNSIWPLLYGRTDGHANNNGSVVVRGTGELEGGGPSTEKFGRVVFRVVQFSGGRPRVWIGFGYLKNHLEERQKEGKNRCEILNVQSSN